MTRYQLTISNMGEGFFRATHYPLSCSASVLSQLPISLNEKISDKIGKNKVSNLLYIKDLKIYAKDYVQMERCKAMIQEFSNDITMEFGLEKCAVIHMRKGEVFDSPIVDSIPL